MRKPKWNLSKIKSLIHKYKSVKNFRKYQYGAYCWIQRNKLSYLFKINKRKIKGKFLENEQIFKKAKKYKTRTSFKNSSRIFYEEANKRGIIEECCFHMKYGKFGSRKKKKYTNTQLIKIAKKYQYKMDLYNSDCSVYRLILVRGLKNQAFKHMLTNKKSPEAMFVESLIKEILYLYPKIIIKQEVLLNKKSRIDLVLTVKNKKYFIECKSENSKTYWTRLEINNQKNKYKKITKSKPLIFVSETGKYGWSKNKLLNFLAKRYL